MSVSTEETPGDGGTPAVPEHTTEPLSAAGSARRRFAKRAGLGSTGVVLTLVSQPGMATLVCKSPSRNMSKLASAHPGEAAVACSGVGPLTWYKSGAWPCSQNACFGNIFPCGNTSDASTPLKTVLGNTATDDTSKFGAALVATYMNVMSGKIGFLTQEDVISMFTEIQSSYQYKPTATTAWSISELTAYLQSTYTGS
jgi:hypothetical protein